MGRLSLKDRKPTTSQVKITSFFKKSISNPGLSVIKKEPTIVEENDSYCEIVDVTPKPEEKDVTPFYESLEVIPVTPSGKNNRKIFVDNVLHGMNSKEVSHVSTLPSNIKNFPELNTTDESLDHSPEFLPPTPIETIHKKSFLFNNSKKNAIKNASKRLLHSNLPNVCTGISKKRSAVEKTGISPNAKRPSELKDLDSVEQCKLNLNKIINEKNVGISVNCENEKSISILQNGLQKLDVSESPQVIPFRDQSNCPALNRDKSDIDTNVVPKIENSYENVCESNVSEKETQCIEENDLFNDSFEDFLNVDLEDLASLKSDKSKLRNQIGDIKSLHPSSFVFKGNYGRHSVLEVNREEYKRELHLQLISLTDKVEKCCILTGFWFESIIKENDIVNILSAEEINGIYRVTDRKGFIVVNPDFLLSGTSVVAGVFCRRKAVLNEKFKGYDSGNSIMLIGSLVHQLFQQVLLLKTVSKNELEKIIEKLLEQKKTLKEMYGLNLTTGNIKNEMNTFVDVIIRWTNEYLANRHYKKSSAKFWNGSISSILDIEENIWSPKHGIKGKIDITVEAQSNGTPKVMPLELKTGRSSFSAEHRGQVILYSMMMSDRRTDPKAGLLLYLRDGSMSEVPAQEMEKKGLIQLRNEIASYLYCNSGVKEKLMSLPDPLDSERACMKCGQLLTCAMFSKVSQNVPENNSAMVSIIPKVVSHLNENDLEYFRKWCLMLQCESADSENLLNKYIWCMDAKEREDIGDCLSNAVLSADKHVTDRNDGYFSHHFARTPNLPHFPKTFQCGDSVVVSSEKEIVLSQGVIYSCEGNSLHLILDRNLKSLPKWENEVYRIDRNYYEATMSLSYTNLALLLENQPRSNNLRSLIIEREKPQFSEGINKNVVNELRTILKNLNQYQKRTILRVILSKDYSILKGYPGTGKTTVVVSLVRILTRLGNSVLLTSNTHSAVDNILLKLKGHSDVNILRLGRLNRIHEGIHAFSDDIQTKNICSVEELESFYNTKNVVACTCLGVNHPIFQRRKFDYCIMDEASQVMQLASIGPLLSCKKFVLVGDSLQLPPIVKSNSARSLGMAESLFERLDVDEATVRLRLQYRMNEPIMNLANGLMYDGELECGSDELKVATVKLPNFHAIKNEFPDWMEKIYSTNVEDSLIFLNTNGHCPESKNSACLTVNVGEAQLILSILTTFIKMSVAVSDIGVITPFRAQVKHIRDSLPSSEIEVNTVDQYQGRDKDIILYSCVRADRSEQFFVKPNEILKDIRRLNVATTRAKFKLILIGDIETLNHFEPFKKMIHLLKPNQIIHLPTGVVY